MLTLDIKTNINEVVESFKKTTKEIEKKAINKGLDKPLKVALKTLKAELRTLVNERIETKPIRPEKKQERTIQETSRLTKSKEVLVKHILGIDLENIKSQANRAEYYQQPGGNKIVFVNSSKGVDANARTTLKIPIGENEDIYSQYSKAVQFFSNSVFAFPDGNGGYNLIIPELDGLEDNVKIQCSSYTGFHDFEEKGVFSPERRFETDKNRKRKDSETPYAEWTLKQEFVKRVEKTGFNINNVINSIINGDVRQAKDAIQTLPSSLKNKKETLLEKIEELEKGENLAPEVQTHNNINQLITNLKIEKTIKNQRVLYKLISSYNDFENVDFIQTMESSISIWKNINEALWIKELVDKIKEAITKFKEEV